MTGNMFSYWLRAAVLFAAAAVLLWPTLQQMESVWRHSETYMHCYFILPIAAYMVWERRAALRGMKPTPALLPVLLLLPVSVLWLSAFAIDVGFVSHLSQVVILQLLLWHVLGHQIALKVRFPLLFLIFLAPFGESLTPALQDITADISVALLRLAEVPVYREGLYLHTTVTVYEVAVACSGLNFLISSAVISLLFAYLYFHRWYKQVIFVVFVLVLAIVANGLRAFLLMLIGDKTNLAWGFGDDHYYYGWAVFAITMLISFKVGDRFAEVFPVAIADQQTTTQQTKPALLASTLALLIFASVYPLRALLPMTAKPSQPTEVLQINGYQPVTQSALGTSFMDGLRRSHLRAPDRTEIFAADYAVRQDQGDLITWHNWVYDPKQWSVTDRITTGPLTDSRQILQLVNINGNKFTLIYWFQLGDVRTSNKMLIKLLQLKAILLHEPVTAGVRMLAVPGLDFASGQQKLQTMVEQQPALLQPPQLIRE